MYVCSYIHVHVYMYNVGVQVNKGPDSTIMRDFYTCVYASSSHNTGVTCLARVELQGQRALLMK